MKCLEKEPHGATLGGSSGCRPRSLHRGPVARSAAVDLAEAANTALSSQSYAARRCWRFSDLVNRCIRIGRAMLWQEPRLPDPQDPLAEIQKKLQAGERVELIGETGEPVWHRWRISPAQFGPAPETPPGGVGPATFHQNLPCLLELICLRYRSLTTGRLLTSGK